MNDPSAALQAAIKTKLLANADFSGFFGTKIFDRVPPSAVTPYAAFGPGQTLEDDADCVEGFEVFQQIDVWSMEPGYQQAKEGAGVIRKAIHRQDLTLDGFVLVEIMFRNIRYLRDPDGLTSHAVIDLRALLETDTP